MNSSDIQRVFRAVSGLFLVLKPDAGFTIIAASDEYLKATLTDAGIFGRKAFDVFPNNPGDPHANGVANVTASLQQVMATGQPHAMPPQRYDVRQPGDEEVYEERYWTITHSPMFDEQGKLEYLIQTAEVSTASGRRDAVAILTNAKILQTERERLALASERQRRIYETALDSTPDFVYVFDLEHRALYANDALLKTWGVTDVRGKKWMNLGYEQWHADMHDRELDQVINTRAHTW